MCGVAGYLHFDPSRSSSQSVIKAMTDEISHRGPDGEGFFLKDALALGHRRLSIIDLSTGDQPMISEDQSVAVIFNGEIYNYVELRDELKKSGHSFKTTSDTEVILKGYQQWGIDCLNYFNGMFAIALWDEPKKQLFLARDRLGEKPLFYCVKDNTLIFSSEIKSILAYGIEDKPNFEVLKLYLTLGYVPAPYTFYQNIFKLKAGNYLSVVNGIIREVSYWDVPVINEKELLTNREFVYNEFESLFLDSVKIRMRSDVPFGAFLSGGLDSSSVVASMNEFSSFPINTFTIGFKEKNYDERTLARSVANQFKTIHHEMLVEPETFDASLKRVIHYYDEPFGDSSAIPTDFVSKFAKQHVKMVLTGDGGDEVLSGYNSYVSEKINPFYLNVPRPFRSMIQGSAALTSKVAPPAVSYKSAYLLDLMRSAEMNFEERLITKASWTTLSNVNNLLPDKHYIEPHEFVTDLLKKYNVADPFYKLMYFHLKVSLPDDMLTKVDRMSMANSLETRVPFLDHRLVELMVNVSKNIKLQGLERKSVLRKTIGKRLPKDILYAPKKGFTVPLRYWFKNGLDGKIQSLSTIDFGLNSKVIKKVLEENNSGKKDHGNFIWILFVLKRWLENY